LQNSQSVLDRFHVAKKLGEVADALRKKTALPFLGVPPCKLSPDSADQAA